MNYAAVQTPSPELVERLGIHKLASLPQATVRLLRVCNDVDSEFAELAAIIGQDAGLTSKMLNVANSPLYAQWGDIADLDRMLVVLGLGTIRTIAITSSVVELFSGVGGEAPGFIGRFWHQSLFCAHLAQKLAQRIGYPNRDEAYLAGLLHRIGQLVLYNHRRRDYVELERVADGPERLLQQEAGLFGIAHDALGAWLIARWQLGGFVSDAVLYQYAPASHMLDAPDLVKIVGVASRLGDPRRRGAALDDAATLLQLDAAAVSPLIEEAEGELEQAAASFGVKLDAPEPLPAAPPGVAERSELAELVKDSALLESVKSAMWQEAKQRNPHAVIRVFLNILFGLEDALLFVADDDGRLQGTATDRTSAWLEQLKLPVERGRSLLCDSLLAGRMIDSFRYESEKGALNVIDRQLIRVGGKPGLLSLPLVAGGQPQGVLAVGMERGGLERLQPQLGLLEMFVGEVAKLLHSHREEARARRLLIAESQAQVLQAARKIRHEANNPLGIVKNYLYILGAELTEGERPYPELDVIREEIERVEHILLGLTERLTGSDAPAGVVDLNGLIAQLLAVLQPALFDPQKIEVSLEPDRAIPPLKADRDKLKQILVNLLKNAAEAMAEGGRVEIHTRDNIFGAGGTCVEIAVSDTGPGLPQAVRERLFQPVATTKGGGHSGLGLSIVGQLVAEVEGSIRCRTGPGGTEFLILVPRRVDEPGVA